MMKKKLFVLIMTAVLLFGSTVDALAVGASSLESRYKGHPARGQ